MAIIDDQKKELLAVGPGPSRVAAAAGRSTSGILRKAEKEAR